MGEVLNVINVVILGILAVASILIAIFLIPVLRELRKTIEKIQGTVDTKISPLIDRAQSLVEETRPKIDNIAQRIESVADEEIKPLASNMKDITEQFNQQVAKVNDIVDVVVDMVSRTHEVVSLYQDKAVIPAYEIISVWAGIKKGASVLFKRENQGGGDSNG
jgi:uncharacterized protein YoxC